MKIYKLRPKFHFFFLEKIDKNDSPCVFVLLFFEYKQTNTLQMEKKL